MPLLHTTEHAVEDEVLFLMLRVRHQAAGMHFINALHAYADPATCTQQNWHIPVTAEGTPLWPSKLRLAA